MIEYIKKEMKHLPFTIVVFVLLYGMVVLADSYAFASAEVSFNNSGTNITATNMQSAINETFLHATDYNEIKTTIGNSTLTTTDQTLTGAINELNGELTAATISLSPLTESISLNSVNIMRYGKVCVCNGWFDVSTNIGSGTLLFEVPSSYRTIDLAYGYTRLNNGTTISIINVHPNNNGSIKTEAALSTGTYILSIIYMTS